MNTDMQQQEPPANQESQQMLDPSVLARYQQELDASQARNRALEEENNLRRLREMRLYEQQEMAASQVQEEELPIDPEAKKVLEKFMAKTVNPLQRELSNLKSQLAQSQASQEALTNVELIRRGAPFIDQISADLMREIKSLPPDEQTFLSRSPNAIVKMAHMIYNQQKRSGVTAQKAATQMASTETGGASPMVIPNQSGPWWREKGYMNLNSEERARADADIMKMKGR